MTICYFSNSDGQVADEERQENGEDHLSDAPFISFCFCFSVILYRGSFVITCAVVKRTGAATLGSLVLAHALFRTGMKYKFFHYKMIKVKLGLHFFITFIV